MTKVRKAKEERKVDLEQLHEVPFTGLVLTGLQLQQRQRVQAIRVFRFEFHDPGELGTCTLEILTVKQHAAVGEVQVGVVGMLLDGPGEQLAGIIQGISAAIDSKISEAKSEIFSPVTESERRLKEEVRKTLRVMSSGGAPTGDPEREGQGAEHQARAAPRRYHRSAESVEARHRGR